MVVAGTGAGTGAGNAQNAPSGAQAGAHSSAQAGALRRSLVVEDDAILGMMIAETLKDLGLQQISVCPSIASALNELDRLKPDLLVLDVHLADRDDGWTIVELLRELSPALPRIVFSTATPESVPPRIAEMGVVLAKPFAPEDLAAAIAAESRPRPGLLAWLKGVLGAHPE